MLEQITSASQALSTTVGGVMDTVGAISGRLEQWSRLRAQTASLIRLLYLEVCKDLELLVLLGEERQLEFGDPRLGFILGHFETGVMELVLHGAECEDVFKKLAAKGRIQDRPEGAKRERLVSKYENVLQAIRFIYVKIDILRKLAAAAKAGAEGAELGAGLRIGERLRNIETRLLLAKRILGELDDNKNIA